MRRDGVYLRISCACGYDTRKRIGFDAAGGQPSFVAFLDPFIGSNGDGLLIVQEGGCVGRVYAVLLEVRSFTRTKGPWSQARPLKPSPGSF